MSQLSSSPLDRILELNNEAEKQKVELTPEVKAYVQAHIEVVQEKLSKGDDVTEDDMKFIDEVRMWVAMSEEWRGKYQNIEAMKENQELMQNYKEAQKRRISIQQWLDLLDLAEVFRKPKSWIDDLFTFPGERKIIVQRLAPYKLAALQCLPENLVVIDELNITGCRSLQSLPKGIEIGSNIYLSHNLQPKVREDAQRLKKEGKIKGEIKYE